MRTFRVIRRRLLARGFADARLDESPAVVLLWRLPLAAVRRAPRAADAPPPLVSHFRGFRQLTKWNYELRCRELRAARPAWRSLTEHTLLLTSRRDDDAPDNERAAVRAAFGADPSPHRVWIAKPAASLQGRGIALCQTAEEALGYVDAAAAGERWVLQKYVEAPRLLRGHKFDLRVFALLTPDLRVLLFPDFVARFASEPFALSRESVAARFAHLTNHAFQRKAPTYNQLAFAPNSVCLSARLYELVRADPDAAAALPAGRDVEDVVMSELARVAAGFLEPLARFLGPRGKGAGEGESEGEGAGEEDEEDAGPDARLFQMFGLDVIFQHDWRATLLEVNGTAGAELALVRELYIEALAILLDGAPPTRFRQVAVLAPLAAAARGR
jgi:hypothetical protein